MESSPSDENYGTVYIGHGDIKKAISLPEELRDGGVLNFDNMEPMGWTSEWGEGAMPGWRCVYDEDGNFCGFEKDD
jgi:hypothetical protein